MGFAGLSGFSMGTMVSCFHSSGTIPGVPEFVIDHCEYLNCFWAEVVDEFWEDVVWSGCFFTFVLKIASFSSYEKFV
jgi:hypothetical protein